MKKSGIVALVMLTTLFVGFLSGFFLGRNLDHGDIQISLFSQSEDNKPTQPTSPTQTDQGSATVPPAPQVAKININTAGKEDLMLLPGIGEVLAMNILNYRNENGPFTAFSDLLLVDGIGEKRLDAILDMITLGG